MSRISFLSLVSFFIINQVFGQCTDHLDLGNDTSFCQGSTLLLDAGNTYLTYNWQNSSGLQTFEVSSTGLYSCTVSSIDFSTNLISNGDFESGNTQFTSDYTYMAIDDITGPNAVYGVINNPNIWFSPFSACPDHTSGTGNMMVLDGSTSNGGTDAFWCQTVTVTANTSYSLRYWSQSVTGAPYANISVEINSLALGSNFAPNVVCSWEETDYIWNSGASITAQICFYDLELSGNGNDFTIDDISMHPVCEYYDEIQVDVFTADTTENIETICEGDSILLSGAMQYTAGTYFDLITSSGCSEYKKTLLIVSPSPEALVPNDTVITAGQVLNISAGNTFPGSTYEWTSTNGDFETNSSFFASPNFSTTYYLSVSRNNCIDTDSFQVIIHEEGAQLFLPTAFSPNNDQINDFFRIINSNEFSEIEMSVYNRWGERIFHSLRTDPLWDGKYKGVDQPLGLYVYYISAKSSNSSEILTSVGNISIIR